MGDSGIRRGCLWVFNGDSSQKLGRRGTAPGPWMGEMPQSKGLRVGAGLKASSSRVSHTHGLGRGGLSKVISWLGQSPSQNRRSSEARARGSGARAGGGCGGGRAARVGVLLVAVVVALHLVPARLTQVAHPALDAAAV